MCGICGIVGTKPGQASKEALTPMAASIQHRGPDDDGFYVSPDRTAGLGFRRLSIIDLHTGHQPISNETGDIWIVFNGEVYNFHALRDELTAAGHSFRTQTDTEAIVHLYEQYGEGCVEKLRGMFAFAIWDEPRRRLFLARDRVGKKPVFYAFDRGRLLFASEMKALLTQLERAPQIDPEAVDLYLAFGNVPPPRTIYQDVHRLQPGHWLRYDASGLEVRRYWDLDFTPHAMPSEPELLRQIEDLLRESVRLRLISDVPLGALLSGGVDSSSVVALMAHESGRPPKTFSVGFEEDDFSELAHARRVAKHLGTEHYEQIVHPNIEQLMYELVEHFDEPFGDSSIIPTFLVCQHARQHITVALSGDGGDETFAGYPRYLYERWVGRAASIPGVSALASSVSLLWPAQWRGKRQMRKMRWGSGLRYAEAVSVVDTEMRHELWGNGRAPQTAREFIRRHYSPRGMDSVSHAQYADSLVNYLPGDILPKVDIASMKVSLEVRSPLLDHQLMEFMAHVPIGLKMRGANPKYLLKKIAERYVPPEVLYRPKQGFTLPLRWWFSESLRPFMESLLVGKESRVAAILRGDVVERLIHEHVTRGVQHTDALYALLALEIWLRRRDISVPELHERFHRQPAAQPAS